MSQIWVLTTMDYTDGVNATLHATEEDAWNEMRRYLIEGWGLSASEVKTRDQVAEAADNAEEVSTWDIQPKDLPVPISKDDYTVNIVPSKVYRIPFVQSAARDIASGVEGSESKRAFADGVDAALSWLGKEVTDTVLLYQEMIEAAQ